MLKSERSAFLKNHKSKIKKILIKIPSEIKYIKKVSSRVLSSLSRYILDEGKFFDIKLCTEEAVRNAIVHGNRSDKKTSVRIWYWVEDGRLSVEIEDEGRGFDRALVADPTENANIMKNSGRGIYLIKKLMDSVEFNDIGNRIRMVKNLK